MGLIHPPPPVKFLCGVLAVREDLFPVIRTALEKNFGVLDLESPVYPFTHTHYYEREMGFPLWRRFYTLEALQTPDRLVAMKLRTNQMEQEMAQGQAQSRPVNLDPGYLEESKLVLASTKNFSHRIYLSDGIFAEVTLQYRQGLFLPHDWTFPDFRAPDYHDFLRAARERLREQEKFRAS